MGWMAFTSEGKDDQINFRIDAEIKRDLKVAAKLRGLSVSSLLLSLIVKTIREEKAIEPEAFREAQAQAVPGKANVVARIEPAIRKADIQRSFEEEVETVGRKTAKIPVLRKKVK